ncbi:hypothetical protein CHU98_g7711 [Xylaria longipes]|nr:hypothetical protein CHU98_g7711 [Xylaria longipes]
MAKSLMKLLAVPALLAGVANGLQWLNDIPLDAYYEPGTEFVLEWTPEDRTDTFRLMVDTFLTTPIIVPPPPGVRPPAYDFKTVNIYVDDAVKFSDGNYTWLIEPVENRTGADYTYRLGAVYGGTYSSPRAFHLEAAA